MSSALVVLSLSTSPGLAVDAAAPVADLRAKPADDWSRLLPDLLPAINACLDRAPGPAPRVTKAWSMNRGMVGVRLRHGRGGWFQCVAALDGGEVERLEALDAGTSRLPGESLVLFAPADQAPLVGECYQHEQVVGADGTPIGWLAYDVC